MGLIVKNLQSVMARISRSEKRVMDGSLSALRAMAELVRIAAVRNAPVDTGELENAISTIEDRTRSTTGQFGQVTIRVGVDTSKLKLEDHKGYDYSVRMHEDPNYNLGLKSEAKQASQGNIVGYKYLERALKDNEEMVKARVAKAVAEGAKG